MLECVMDPETIPEFLGEQENVISVFNQERYIGVTLLSNTVQALLVFQCINPVCGHLVRIHGRGIGRSQSHEIRTTTRAQKKSRPASLLSVPFEQRTLKTARPLYSESSSTVSVRMPPCITF